MSDTTTVEPPVEAHPLLRRASDPKPLPPKIVVSTPPAAPQNGFSFIQVAVLIGIAVFINGAFLLFVALRTPAVPAAAVVKKTHAAKPAVVPAATPQPVAVEPVTAQPAVVEPVAVKPAASEPAEVRTAPVHHTHVVKHPPVAAETHVAAPAPTPAVASAPVALTAPNIDTVQYDGPIIHMAWKSLGKDVTYKVYVSPNVSQPSYEFRFNKYGPSMDWFLNENKAWRYVAITVVDKSGRESTLSNTVDTTPSLPRPEY